MPDVVRRRAKRMVGMAKSAMTTQVVRIELVTVTPNKWNIGSAEIEMCNADIRDYMISIDAVNVNKYSN